MPGQHQRRGNHHQGRNNGGNRGNNYNGQQPAMTAIDAPYNFVPLADKVVTPYWAEQVSHDVPFEDGLSGEIHYTLTAHSPLLVGGQQVAANQNRPGKVHFFKTLDNQFAIPGSSIKGMIRAVLEIVTFSRMSMVDDCRYSVRDLTNLARPFYGDEMTERVTPSGQEYRAKPTAGWLSLSPDGSWQITPCEYSRVEHDHLADLTGNEWWLCVDSCNAEEKYRRWRDTCSSLDTMFDPGPVTLHNHSRGMKLEYSKASDVGRGSTPGTLVFTGQPGKRIPGRSGKKHLEFIFHTPAVSPFAVPAGIMHDFLHIHRKRDGYKGEEWEYWKDKPQVPVFYLTDNKGAIESLGLALMYKLAYRHSIHQVIGHTGNGIHLKTDSPDFATLMFGRVGDEPQDMLKGRVWFEMAVPVENTVREIESRTVVLNAPKPTYYPNYVKQKTTNRNQLSSQSYKTYMDGDAEIRGWKRYPARPELTESTQGTGAVSTTLYPLDTGAKFSGRVVFHNLKPVELGALLWGVTWGGKDEFRHGLGMGKSLGYGQVALSLDDHNIIANSSKPEPDLTNYIEIFIKYIGGKVPNWDRTPQILSLCDMANPAKANQFNGELKHMMLGRPNQFVEAKNAGLVLADYALVTADFSGSSNGNGGHSAKHSWLIKNIPLLAKKHNAKISDIWGGKTLAEAWANDKDCDAETKQTILKEIKAYWQQHGWWDNPPKGAKRKAKEIYEDKE